MWGKRITLFLTGCVLFMGSIYGQKYIKPIDEKFIRSRFIDENGEEVIQIIIPGSPAPATFQSKKAVLTSTAVIIDDVPATTWCFGCTATSAAMLAGYYDRQGFVNMYAGPTNDGVFPLTNALWGTASINGETRALCPLSATRNGLDGRTTRGHVDDYWIKYNSSSSDPYITNSWAEHTYEDCTADFMKTNQSAYGNSDGSTTFYIGGNGTKYSGTNINDGPYGFQLFMESRGYTVSTRYSQTIVGYNGYTTGFSFNNYVSEINAGRPVFIHLSGHTMLGVGYDYDTQTIFMHDTWDYNTHSMTWGGTYSAMQHIAVSVFALADKGFVDNNLTITNTTFNSVDECLDAMDTITVAGDGNAVNINSEASVSFIAGAAIRFLPGFHAQSGSTMTASITTDYGFCIPQGYSASTAVNTDKNLDSYNENILDATVTNLETEVKVYPNPSNGHFTVELPQFDGDATITLYNIHGKIVYRTITGSNTNPINQQGIPKGLYLINIQNGEKSITQKIIIQ